MQQNLPVFNIEYEWIIPTLLGLAMFTLAFMFLKYVVLSSHDDDDNEEKKENSKTE